MDNKGISMGYYIIIYHYNAIILGYEWNSTGIIMGYHWHDNEIIKNLQYHLGMVYTSH